MWKVEKMWQGILLISMASLFWTRYNCCYYYIDLKLMFTSENKAVMLVLILCIRICTCW